MPRFSLLALPPEETPALDEIEGVGAARKRSLLHAFGSARGVSRASAEDLAKVEGVSEALAQRVFDYFRKS